MSNLIRNEPIVSCRRLRWLVGPATANTRLTTSTPWKQTRKEKFSPFKIMIAAIRRYSWSSISFSFFFFFLSSLNRIESHFLVHFAPFLLILFLKKIRAKERKREAKEGAVSVECLLRPSKVGNIFIWKLKSIYLYYLFDQTWNGIKPIRDCYHIFQYEQFWGYCVDHWCFARMLVCLDSADEHGGLRSSFYVCSSSIFLIYWPINVIVYEQVASKKVGGVCCPLRNWPLMKKLMERELHNYVLFKYYLCHPFPLSRFLSLYINFSRDREMDERKQSFELFDEL